MPAFSPRAETSKVLAPPHDDGLVVMPNRLTCKPKGGAASARDADTGIAKFQARGGRILYADQADGQDFLVTTAFCPWLFGPAVKIRGFSPRGFDRPRSQSFCTVEPSAP